MIWFTAYIGSVLGGLCTMIAVTMMRRGESRNLGMIGWLALIVLSPPIGLVLFLICGGRKISSEHSRREKIELPTDPDYEIDAKCGPTHLVEQRGLNRPTGGNEVRLLDSPQSRYRDFFQLIDRAEKSICITSYILKEDLVSERLIPKLCEKTRKGVGVYLLVDGLGSLTLRNRFLRPLREAGAQIAVFKPLTKLSRFAYLNYRNHRKLLVVDGGVAIMGGANFVTDEMAEEPSADTWIDLNIAVEGFAAAQVQAVFNSDWKFVTGENLPKASCSAAVQQPKQGRACSNPDRCERDAPAEHPASEVQVVPCGADCPHDLLDDLLLHTIQQAQERLWIVTPFFIPPPLTMRSLEIACRRGVDVHLIYPDRTDVRAADYARYDYIRELQGLGAKVFRYPDRIVHAKAILVDHSAAMVGSANFDMRSFFLNYELLALFQDRPTIDRMADWFQSLKQECVEGEVVVSRLHRVLSVSARLIADEL